MKLEPKAEELKCFGAGCEKKASCTRFLRPDAGFNQQWAAFYEQRLFSKDKTCRFYIQVEVERVR